MLIALFGFDLEDDIFDDQVASAADRLAASDMRELQGSGTVSALDMTYYVGRVDMPEWLLESAPVRQDAERGEIFAEERGHFHLVTRTLENGQRLYVLFDARPFIRSTPQLASYLLIALVMALLAFLVSLLFLRRMIASLSEPLEKLSSRISWTTADLAVPYPVADKAPEEVHLLAEALHARDRRIAGLLDRERAFNRDASHELRTPLAVAVGALELIEEKSDESRALSRLRTALADMQRLVDGILWLGREPNGGERCDARSAVQASIDAHRHLLRDRPCDIRDDGGNAVSMPVPLEVGLVLIGNLVRNAVSYSQDGPIKVLIETRSITVRDSGSGFGQTDKGQEGFGIGLSLVQRLGDHFGVTLSIRARPEGGTDAVLQWPPAI
ncbi:HAMP domain-containing sensor histidine kinase [Parasphingopyxis sp.]|uniref:sensor histidine kinase n=1 Tax=Parasphingopyxis sp. TaxID=1920299 RepID=UPI00261D852B|nr:HAMP domain-containing sensor histidine kinase [Parasphingopyxis sp.]